MAREQEAQRGSWQCGHGKQRRGERALALALRPRLPYAPDSGICRNPTMVHNSSTVGGYSCTMVVSTGLSRGPPRPWLEKLESIHHSTLRASPEGHNHGVLRQTLLKKKFPMSFDESLS